MEVEVGGIDEPGVEGLAGGGSGMAGEGEGWSG